MPKEFFQLSKVAELSSLVPGAKIHVSGVAGVAMAQLAVALSTKGFQVSGSDKEFYEPMGSFLKGSSVKLCRGYSASNIPADVSLVVIGNALSYGNEEVLAVEQGNIPYTLFPKVLFDLAITGRHSIVVSGTHGKSTTTSMMAWILNELKTNPSYFIGAAVPGFETSLVAGTGKFSVVEGDEYDSAFFAKVPKFTFYKPNTLIITAIEYDHADIYPDLRAITDQFTKLIASMKPDGRVICCIDDPVVRGLLPQWRSIYKGQVVSYGFTDGADVKVLGCNVHGQLQLVTVSSQLLGERDFQLKMPGKHNALNATAALIAAGINKLDLNEASRALASFNGTKRRQEVRVSNERAVLIDDFAHHPTAVRETIAAIRTFYPGKKLWAVFEPRSNTSRRKVFQSEYIKAFKQADEVVLCEVQARSIDAGLELIDVGELATEIGRSGVKSRSLPGVENIKNYLIENVSNGDVVLVMSNGGFGGLVGDLEAAFKSSKT